MRQEVPKRFSNLPVMGKLSAKESLASSSGMTSKKYQRGISKPKKQHSIIRPAKEKKINRLYFLYTSDDQEIWRFTLDNAIYDSRTLLFHHIVMIFRKHFFTCHPTIISCTKLYQRQAITISSQSWENCLVCFFIIVTILKVHIYYLHHVSHYSWTN
jgi:hypothetical protein